MIYLIVETISNSGINTWNTNFTGVLSRSNIKYTVINLSNTTGYMDIIKKIKDSIIIFNNVKNTELLNEQTLVNINDNNNRMYIVIHGDICPTNKAFVIFNKIFYGVISISKKIKSIILKHYPNKHVIYFPNKILDIYGSIDRKFNKHNVNFGFVGRIAKEKNIPLILRAFRKYTDTNNNCRLHIFGNCDNDIYNKYINNLIILLGIGEYVIRYGYMQDINNIYNKIDILLLPSVSEGIPYCVIEASYYGVPTIATNVGCVNEIIKHRETGVLFDLTGYPNIKSLYVNSYDYVLQRVGYISYIRTADNSEVTDTKIHSCKKQVCMIDTTFNIISPLDCKVNSTVCNACVELLSKKTIFQKNIDSLTEQMIWSVDNYECFNVVKIYKNIDIKRPVKELVKNKIYDTDSYNEYYPVIKNDNMVIDTSKVYGVYYLQSFRPLPYTITAKYQVRGSCYMFVCEGDKNDPFIIYDMIDSEQTIKLRIKNPGYYKVGFKFRDDCVGGLLKITDFKINMYDVPIGIGTRFMISRYDIKIIDPERYVKNQNLNNMLFMFVTCNKPKYIDRREYLYNFLKTFGHKYIVIEGGSDKLFFNSATNVLNIDINETYENLPKKIIKAYEWIYKQFSNITHIYKVDDNFCDKILNFIPANFSTYNYYGNFIVETLINTWHQGKCDDETLNNTIYSKDFINPYAGGGYGYILSKTAVKVLIDNKDNIINDIYEDKAIGDVLYINNIKYNTAEFVDNTTIINNQTVDFVGYGADNSQVTITYHSYNNNCILYIIEDKQIIYQHYFNYLPRISFNNNCLTEIHVNSTTQLFHYRFGEVREHSKSNIDLSKIKVSPNSTKTDIGLRYNLECDNICKIELIDRVWFNFIYLIKWDYLGVNVDLRNINSINKKLIRVSNLYDIKYEDINNYDVVLF